MRYRLSANSKPSFSSSDAECELRADTLSQEHLRCARNDEVRQLTDLFVSMLRIESLGIKIGDSETPTGRRLCCRPRVSGSQYNPFDTGRSAGLLMIRRFIATVCCRACRSQPIIRISASFDPSAVGHHTAYSARREADSLCHQLPLLGVQGQGLAG